MTQRPNMTLAAFARTRDRRRQEHLELHERRHKAGSTKLFLLLFEVKWAIRHVGRELLPD